MGKNNKNPSKSKARKPFEKVLDIVLVVFSVLALAVSGVLAYQKWYLSPFWVNGQSMYPTLNSNIVDKDGNPLGEYYVKSKMDGAKNVDYGVMDEHKSAIKRIKRFDIVVCQYSDGDTSDKIKRVLGLPGETIKFDTTYTETRGDLYVKASNGVFELVEQPIEKKYINSAAAEYPAITITLGEGEYFVAGDNRAHSADCRTSETHRITKNLIVGKVVAIVGTCESYLTSSGNFDIRNIDYYKWPRFM